MYTVNRVKTGTTTASVSLSGASSFTWVKTSSSPSNIQWIAYSNGTQLDVILNGGQSGTFTVTANNVPGCGSSSRSVTFYNQASFLYAVSPNPASSNLTVTAQKAENNPAFDDQSIQDEVIKLNDQQFPSFEVSLYDQFGQLVQKKTNPDKGLLVSFDVQSLPPGRYILRIVDKEQSIGHHIIIE